MAHVLKNPIIPGFYPDPSICRVGEDYYLVYAPIGETGWSLGELVNSEEVLSDARSLGLQVRENLQELQGAAAPLFPVARSSPPVIMNQETFLTKIG